MAFEFKTASPSVCPVCQLWFTPRSGVAVPKRSVKNGVCSHKDETQVPNPEAKVDNYDGVRICAVPDQLGTEAMCRFPRGPGLVGPVRIGWYMTGLLPGWAEQNQKLAFVEAWAAWEEVANIKAIFYDSSSEAIQNLSVGKLEGIVTVNTATMDGPSGVLADSYLPCGTVRIRQRYDSSEAWVNAEQPFKSSIDLVRVACHEIGHAIGLPHIGSGNLLQPMYSSAIRRPQAGDIAEAVQRYGPRVALPAPPTVPTPQPAPGGGGMGGFLDLLKKIAPLLQLLQDPEFLKLIDLIVKIFGSKTSVTKADVEALQAELGQHAQSMTAP